LSVDSLTNLTPHPLKVFLEYSHPPILQRIIALRTLCCDSDREDPAVRLQT
jgi:STE24 endopeptidase